MNIMFKLCMIAVMAISFTFTPEASASDRNAQIMRERNVQPSVLADRIERECKQGGVINANCKPTGSNATVGQMVDSINSNPERRELVASAGDLPRFLRGLRKGPFNEAQCLAGMNGAELAAYCRNVRAPHPGEAGWWHGDLFVLAGDCLNARVGFYVPTMPDVVATGTRWKAPPTSQWNDPFAGQTAGEQCPLDGARLTGVHVFAQEALNTPCARQFVHDRSRNTSGRGTVGSWVQNGNEDVFSLKCGAAMHAAANAGKIGWSQEARRVELNLVHNGQSQLVFAGTVTGNILASADENSALLLTPDKMFVDVPPELTTGVLVWSFPDGGMASPTESGAGMNISRLQRTEGCRPKVKVASAIEGTTSGSGYAYDD